MNKSLPPVKVFVRGQFLYNFESGFGEYAPGYLVSVRSIMNQALQFSVLLDNGALFTGLPANAICFDKEAPALTLSACQMWNNISNEIDVFTIDLLRNMDCSVKVNDLEGDESGIVHGYYLFSIDYVGKDTLATTPDQWKQFQVIQTYCGNLVVYPSYRIKFLDKALCDKSNEDFPKYKVNSTTWLVED